MNINLKQLFVDTDETEISTRHLKRELLEKNRFSAFAGNLQKASLRRTRSDSTSPPDIDEYSNVTLATNIYKQNYSMMSKPYEARLFPLTSEEMDVILKTQLDDFSVMRMVRRSLINLQPITSAATPPHCVVDEDDTYIDIMHDRNDPEWKINGSNSNRICTKPGGSLVLKLSRK